MIFMTTNGKTVRVPDKLLCVSVGTKSAIAWCGGEERVPEVFDISLDTAHRILRKLSDSKTCSS